MNGAELDPRQPSTVRLDLASGVVVEPGDVLAISFPTGTLDEDVIAALCEAFDRLGISDRVVIFDGVNLAALKRDEAGLAT